MGNEKLRRFVPIPRQAENARIELQTMAAKKLGPDRANLIQLTQTVETTRQLKPVSKKDKAPTSQPEVAPRPILVTLFERVTEMRQELEDAA